MRNKTPSKSFVNLFFAELKSVTYLQLIANYDCKRSCKNLKTISALFFEINTRRKSDNTNQFNNHIGKT